MVTCTAIRRGRGRRHDASGTIPCSFPPTVPSCFPEVAYDRKAGDEAVRVLAFNGNVVDEIGPIDAREPTCDERFTPFSRKPNDERFGMSCAPFIMSTGIERANWPAWRVPDAIEGLYRSARVGVCSRQ